jgi:hypothetical protein
MRAIFSRRDRIAHALLAYPFAARVDLREAVQAIVETMNERISPPEQQFAAHWTPASGEYAEEGDGEWEIGQVVVGPDGYQCLRNLVESPTASPAEHSALAVADLIMFGLSYWKCVARSKVFRSWLRAEALVSEEKSDFEELARFSRLVNYAWNEGFECKRIIGLSLLATSASSLQRERRIEHGIGDIKLAAHSWKQLFRMYSHEPELWNPVRIEPIKKTYDGLFFWVGDEPVDTILTRLLEGRLRDSVPLQVGRELLRWMCLPEVE